MSNEVEKPSDAQKRLTVMGTDISMTVEAAKSAFGSTDEDFVNGLLGQLINAGSIGKTIDQKGTLFLLSIVKGVEPRDQVEAMLATQMAARRAQWQLSAWWPDATGQGDNDGIA